MDEQLVKLKRFHEHFVGVRVQMANLAVLCHMSAKGHQRKRGTKCWYYPELAIFNAERNMERVKRVREENKRIAGLSHWGKWRKGLVHGREMNVVLSLNFLSDMGLDSPMMQLTRLNAFHLLNF